MDFSLFWTILKKEPNIDFARESIVFNIPTGFGFHIFFRKVGSHVIIEKMSSNVNNFELYEIYELIVGGKLHMHIHLVFSF